MLTNDFIRAWYSWQHCAEPVANFRLKRTDAPTYEIESAIDHLASYTYSLGSSLIGQGDWNHHKLASEELVELEKISSELESCAISETEKTEFREYMAVTRALLEAIAREATGGGTS